MNMEERLDKYALIAEAVSYANTKLLAAIKCIEEMKRAGHTPKQVVSFLLDQEAQDKAGYTEKYQKDFIPHYEHFVKSALVPPNYIENGRLKVDWYEYPDTLPPEPGEYLCCLWGDVRIGKYGGKHGEHLIPFKEQSDKYVTHWAFMPSL